MRLGRCCCWWCPEKRAKSNWSWSNPAPRADFPEWQRRVSRAVWLQSVPGIIDPVFGGGERRERRRKKTGAPYDSFTFAAFPQWCKQQKGRRVEKRMGKRERGRRGVLLLWKNDAAAVLGGCRLGRDREWGERGGRGGEACSIRGEWCGFHGSYPIRRSPPVHRRPQYSKVTNSQCPIFPRRLHGCRCALTPLSAREEKRKKIGRKWQLWWAKAER